MRKDSHTSVEVSVETSLISHRISLIIALACIAVYVFALMFAGVRAFRMTAMQNALAAQEFADLVEYAAREGNRDNGRGFMDSQFQANINHTLGLYKTLQAVIISDGTNDFAFERTHNAGIEWNNGKPSFKESLALSDSGRFFAPLSIENQRNITLRAVHSRFDYPALILILKQTLAIVVVAFCIACITFLLRTVLGRDAAPITLGGGKKRSGGARANPFDEPDDDDILADDEPDASDEAEDADAPNDPDTFDDLFDTDDLDAPQDEEAAADDGAFLNPLNDDDIPDADDDFGDIFGDMPSESDDTLPPFAEMDAPDEAPADDISFDLSDLDEPEEVKPPSESVPDADLPDTGVPDDTASDEPTMDINDMPISADISADEFAGLFPKEEEPTYTEAGLNWEANTLDKLEDELHKSAEFYNNDLCVIAMEVSDAAVSDADAEQAAAPVSAGEVFAALASDAVDFFVMRELVFERGARGLIIIAQDTDIDAGFAKASEFRAGFFTKHPEYATIVNLFAGVSSRCGREVDPDRLIREAGAALAKASDGSPIVAFRVDPEKYKEFLKKQSGGV
jgi:hypothetical protein